MLRIQIKKPQWVVVVGCGGGVGDKGRWGGPRGRPKFNTYVNRPHPHPHPPMTTLKRLAGLHRLSTSSPHLSPRPPPMTTLQRLTGPHRLSTSSPPPLPSPTTDDNITETDRPPQTVYVIPTSPLAHHR